MQDLLDLLMSIKEVLLVILGGVFTIFLNFLQDILKEARLRYKKRNLARSRVDCNYQYFPAVPIILQSDIETMVINVNYCFHLKLWIHNGFDEPIYNPRISLFKGKKFTSSLSERKLDPEKELSWSMSKDVEHSASVNSVEKAEDQIPETFKRPKVLFEFTLKDGQSIAKWINR